MARTNEWTEETKVCSRCGKTKPLSEFNKDSSAKDGLQHWCRQCQKEYDAERAPKYREKNREEIRARNRVYYSKNKDIYSDYRLKRTFGISLVDYDAMLEAQGGGCAICGQTPKEEGRRLCVDHDHKTGEVRGLLCNICNRCIGFLQDDSELCRQMMLYLRSYGS